MMRKPMWIQMFIFLGIFIISCNAHVSDDLITEPIPTPIELSVREKDGSPVSSLVHFVANLSPSKNLEARLPTGTIRFAVTEGGSSYSVCPPQEVLDKRATCEIIFTREGTYKVEAEYSGDDMYAASSTSTTYTASKSKTVLGFENIPQNSVFIGSQFPFQVTLSKEPETSFNNLQPGSGKFIDTFAKQTEVYKQKRQSKKSTRKSLVQPVECSQPTLDQTNSLKYIAQCTFDASNLDPGSYTITANYLGNDIYQSDKRETTVKVQNKLKIAIELQKGESKPVAGGLISTEFIATAADEIDSLEKCQLFNDSASIIFYVDHDRNDRLLGETSFKFDTSTQKCSITASKSFARKEQNVPGISPEYAITAEYSGNSTYSDATDTISYNPNLIPITLQVKEYPQDSIGGGLESKIEISLSSTEAFPPRYNFLGQFKLQEYIENFVALGKKNKLKTQTLNEFPPTPMSCTLKTRISDKEIDYSCLFTVPSQSGSFRVRVYYPGDEVYEASYSDAFEITIIVQKKISVTLQVQPDPPPIQSNILFTATVSIIDPETARSQKNAKNTFGKQTRQAGIGGKIEFTVENKTSPGYLPSGDCLNGSKDLNDVNSVQCKMLFTWPGSYTICTLYDPQSVEYEQPEPHCKDIDVGLSPMSLDFLPVSEDYTPPSSSDVGTRLPVKVRLQRFDKSAFERIVQPSGEVKILEAEITDCYPPENNIMSHRKKISERSALSSESSCTNIDKSDKFYDWQCLYSIDAMPPSMGDSGNQLCLEVKYPGDTFYGSANFYFPITVNKIPLKSSISITGGENGFPNRLKITATLTKPSTDVLIDGNFDGTISFYEGNWNSQTSKCSEKSPEKPIDTSTPSCATEQPISNDSNTTSCLFDVVTPFDSPVCFYTKYTPNVSTGNEQKFKETQSPLNDSASSYLIGLQKPKLEFQMFNISNASKELEVFYFEPISIPYKVSVDVAKGFAGQKDDWLADASLAIYGYNASQDRDFDSCNTNVNIPEPPACECTPPNTQPSLSRSCKTIKSKDAVAAFYGIINIPARHPYFQEGETFSNCVLNERILEQPQKIPDQCRSSSNYIYEYNYKYIHNYHHDRFYK